MPSPQGMLAHNLFAAVRIKLGAASNVTHAEQFQFLMV